MSAEVTDYEVPWYTRLLDVIWRTALFLAFQVFVAYCAVLRPRVQGVYVAVWYEKRVLVVENSYRPKLYFPSGGVRRGESPLAAARRELREEVGLEIAPNRFARSFEARLDHDNMKDFVTIFEVFLDSPPTIKLDRREVIAARFVSVNDLSAKNTAVVVSEYLRRRT